MRYIYLLAALSCLAACGSKDNFTPEDNEGLQLATNVSIFESKGNQQQWLLTAEAVDFADLQNATLKNPVLLLKKNGQEHARLTGHTGSFDYTNKLVKLEGNARVDALHERLSITAERFLYDIDKDRVWSDVKTVITRQSAKAVARGGIETDSKLSKIELKKQRTRLPQDTRELQRKP